MPSADDSRVARISAMRVSSSSAAALAARKSFRATKYTGACPSSTTRLTLRSTGTASPSALRKRVWEWMESVSPAATSSQKNISSGVAVSSMAGSPTKASRAKPVSAHAAVLTPTIRKLNGSTKHTASSSPSDQLLSASSVMQRALRATPVQWLAQKSKQSAGVAPDSPAQPAAGWQA